MSKYSVQELMELDKEGHKKLNEEAWEEAAEIFEALLEVDDNPPLRNNLAYALQMQGEHKKALLVLEPILTQEIISPYARALTALILTDLKREEEARYYLEEAIKQFDAGVRDPLALGIEPKAWREYTVIIKRAAGALGDHHLVYDLHKKWERFYQRDEDFFQAGVALFNRGYPGGAVKPFSRIAGGPWSFVQGYIKTAELIARGIIPIFELPYLPPKLKEPDDAAEDTSKEAVLDPGMRALVLAGLFDADFPADSVRGIIGGLVSVEDPWGTSFAYAILESNSLPMEWKMAAGFALIEKGVIAEDEPIAMMVEGERREVVLETRVLGPATPEQLEKLKGVQKLLMEENYEEALEILENEFAEDNLPLEGLELLAKLYATLGDEENTEFMVKLLLNFRVFGNEDVINVIITDIYLRLGDFDQAEDYLARVSPQDLPKGLKPRYDSLREQLR